MDSKLITRQKTASRQWRTNILAKNWVLSEIPQGSITAVRNYANDIDDGISI